jgi:hypothetical protein
VLILALFFTGVSISGDLSRYNSQAFNLIYYVPFFLWIAVFVLGLLLIFFSFSKSKGFSPKSTNRLIFLIILIILLVFYGLPYIVESNPRFIDSWVHGRTAKGILDNGRLQAEEFRYHSYPGSFIFLSCLSMITNIEITSLLRITPLIYITMLFTSLTLAFEEIFHDLKLASISTLIYGLSTFYLAFHFSPEIFGWISFFLLLAIVGKEAIGNNKSNTNLRRYITLLMLIVIGITITHLVTQFLILLVMLTFIMLRKKINSKLVTYGIALFTAISFLTYSLSFSISYIHGVIEAFKTAFETVLFEATSSIAAQPFTTYYPPEVADLILYRRILYFAVIATAAFGAFLLKKEKKRPFISFSILIFVSIILVPLTVFGILPLERSIKLSFISLSAFSAYLILKKRKIGIILLSLLLLTLPINFASYYWNEAGRYMTHDWEVTSAHFISSNFHGTLLAEYKETTILKFYGNFNKVYDDFQLIGERPDIFNSTFIKEQNIKIVQITQLTILRESWAKRNLDINQFINSPSFNCIYSSEYSTTISNNNAK